MSNDNFIKKLFLLLYKIYLYILRTHNYNIYHLFNFNTLISNHRHAFFNNYFIKMLKKIDDKSQI